MRPWDVFVPDQRANTCPVGEDCQAILYPGVQDAILFPCVTRLFTDSDCLEVLLASEGGMGRVFREQLASTCPVAVTIGSLWSIGLITRFLILVLLTLAGYPNAGSHAFIRDHLP